MNLVEIRQKKNLEKVNFFLDQGFSITKSCQKACISRRNYYNMIGKKSNKKSNKKINKTSNKKSVSFSSETSRDIFLKRDESTKMKKHDLTKNTEIELCKSDGTPLKTNLPSSNIFTRSKKNKDIHRRPPKEKPVEKYSKQEIDDELEYFFSKVK